MNASANISDSTSLIIGIANLLLGTISYFLYVPIIYIILSSKELWERSAFKIMGVMGLLDMITLTTGTFYMGVLTLKPPLTAEVPIWVDKLVSATFISGHTVYLIQAHLLAFNRFVLMAASGFVDSLFGNNRLWIWIGASCSVGAVMMLLYMSPNAGLRFSAKYGMFVHPPEYDWNFGMITFLRVGIIVNLIGISFWYALTVAMVVCKRKTVSSDSSHGWGKEALVSLQAFLIGGTLTQCWTLWLFISFFGAHLLYLCNIDCIFLSGMNAPLYLMFNATIRREFVTLLRLEKCIKIPVRKNTVIVSIARESNIKV